MLSRKDKAFALDYFIHSLTTSRGSNHTNPRVCEILKYCTPKSEYHREEKGGRTIWDTDVTRDIQNAWTWIWS